MSRLFPLSFPVRPVKMALSQPKLNANGQQALDALLKKTAEERKNPAAFFGATNAKEEIYFGCGGEKVFGKPEEGMVNQDTSKYTFLS